MTNARDSRPGDGFEFPFIRPVIPSPEEWTPHLTAAYAARQFSNFGPVNTRLEKGMAARFGNGRTAVTVSSCTAGLTAVLQGLRIRGKVIIPSFTFSATVSALTQAECVPIFCDCEADTLHLSRQALETMFTLHPDAVAVMPVRALGLWADIDGIVELCRARRLPLVVDAAAALGSRALGNSRGDIIEVFSMHATKTFAIGEGGLVLCPVEREAEIRRATNFGLSSGEAVGPGANAKLSEFHAAIGLAVLERFSDAVAARRRVSLDYGRALSGSRFVERTWELQEASWYTFPVLCRPGFDSEAAIERARRRGVDIRRYYLPLHTMPQFAGVARGALPVTDDIARRTICLPVYPDMTPREQTELLDRLGGILL